MADLYELLHGSDRCLAELLEQIELGEPSNRCVSDLLEQIERGEPFLQLLLSIGIEIPDGAD